MSLPYDRQLFDSLLTTTFSDLDDPAQGELDIYSGRGMLIESSGPVWLLGTGKAIYSFC